MRQRDIAARLGVSEASVSKWANGHESVPPSLMRPLAKMLNVDVEVLVPPGRPEAEAEDHPGIIAA